MDGKTLGSTTYMSAASIETISLFLFFTQCRYCERIKAGHDGENEQV
jgi:hypothetical protein